MEKGTVVFDIFYVIIITVYKKVLPESFYSAYAAYKI